MVTKHSWNFKSSSCLVCDVEVESPWNYDCEIGIVKLWLCSVTWLYDCHIQSLRRVFGEAEELKGILKGKYQKEYEQLMVEEARKVRKKISVVSCSPSL